MQLDQGLALAKRHPNVWLELASQSVSNVRRLVERARRAILHDNAARLLGIAAQGHWPAS